MNKFITAKFKGSCAQTGAVIKKGGPILYDTYTKEVFCRESGRYKSELDAANTASYIRENEEAYYDDFCRKNNI
jgi:hypothetical protein